MPPLDIERRKLLQSDLAEARADLILDQLAVPLQGPASNSPGGFPQGEPVAHELCHSQPDRFDVAARIHRGDNLGAFGLRFSFSLGFKRVPFASALSGGRIADVEDRVPVALTAFAYMALHNAFPTGLALTVASPRRLAK